MRIMISEDDATSRLMLEAVLKQLGHEVVSTSDGRETMEALELTDHPRLIILDWMMPVVNGLDICRRVRQKTDRRQPYIIILTSRGEKSDIVEGLMAGADDYIAKPFELEELKARIEVGKRVVGLQDALADRIEELERAMSEIKTLRGIIPICSYCKKIRDDRNYWQQVDSYISRHSQAMFSHSVCPECMERARAEMLDED